MTRSAAWRVGLPGRKHERAARGWDTVLEPLWFEWLALVGLFVFASTPAVN